MKCPYCAHLGDKVVDSRESKEGEVIRRRRECLECGKRFTSYERIDEIPYMVVKKDGTRERFERQKLIGGLLKACEKRPVSVAALEAVADRVEATLQERPEKEIATADIGAFVMEELKKLDKVAYVRFASVYRHFRDIGEFMNELKDSAERERMSRPDTCHVVACVSSSCMFVWSSVGLAARRRRDRRSRRSARDGQVLVSFELSDGVHGRCARRDSERAADDLLLRRRVCGAAIGAGSTGRSASMTDHARASGSTT